MSRCRVGGWGLVLEKRWVAFRPAAPCGTLRPTATGLAHLPGGEGSAKKPCSEWQESRGQQGRPPWFGSSPYLSSSLVTSTAPCSTATCKALLKMSGSEAAVGDIGEGGAEGVPGGSSLRQRW